MTNTPSELCNYESVIANMQKTIDEKDALIAELVKYLEVISGTEQTVFSYKNKVKYMAEYARGGLALSSPVAADEIESLRQQLAQQPSVDVADGFGTEDEHWAPSLDELAEQFLNSYEAGEIITVHKTKSLPSQDYKYRFDANGKPFLEAMNQAKPIESKEG